MPLCKENVISHFTISRIGAGNMSLEDGRAREKGKGPKLWKQTSDRDGGKWILCSRPPPLPSAGTQPGEFCWNNLFRIKIRVENNPTRGGKSVTCFSISVEIFLKKKSGTYILNVVMSTSYGNKLASEKASRCEQLWNIKGYDNIFSKLMLRSEKQETRWHMAIENMCLHCD